MTADPTVPAVVSALGEMADVLTLGYLDDDLDRMAVDLAIGISVLMVLLFGDSGYHTGVFLT